MGTRSGSGSPSPPGYGAAAAEPDAGRFDSTAVLDSGSEDSDSADDEDPARASPGGGGKRDVKRERDERAPLARPPPGAPEAKPGKKTRGRVKIKMAFIDNKLRRYTTFSKRKTGIMKKAYELSTLTGTQVLLLVASETGHVYTFATRKLQPMITSETGKALIQTCLNSPDSPPPRSDPSCDQRMSAAGFQETDLTYQVSEAADACPAAAKDLNKVVASVSDTAPGTPPASSSPSGQTAAAAVPPPPAAGTSVAAAHLMYPASRALTPSLADAGLAVLNAAPRESVPVPQVFLASLPPVAAQIPVSAVQLHPMMLSQQNGGGGATLTELQLVSLDAPQAD
ncbi:serum response factor-like [Hippocampus comes]|uniref:serum response factor-like n=1 Tax=Hippocampus comes TaxID=109280 RepID=UPI00094E5683|nr:PREDICTED: serum response factor-like [Hippocampus comes]